MGLRVRAIARPSSDLAPLAHLPVDWFVGELHDPCLVARAMRGVQVVFHVASPYREAQRVESEQRCVHVESTQLLARAALEQPGFRRFVHVSTVGVHGHIENPPADESYPFGTGDSYQQTKLEGERWIADFGRDSGLPVVVVRPAAIYGPGDRRLLKVFRMAALRVVPLIGHGRCLYHLIHVEDLVDFLVLAAGHPKAVGEVFICGGRDPIPLEDFVRIAGACYGVRNRFVRVPDKPVMALAVVCERICLRLGVAPPLYPRRVAFFTKDRAFDTSKARRLLGFEAAHGDREGIEATARWYLERGWVTRRSRGWKLGTRLCNVLRRLAGSVLVSSWFWELAYCSECVAVVE